MIHTYSPYQPAYDGSTMKTLIPRACFALIAATLLFHSSPAAPGEARFRSLETARVGSSTAGVRADTLFLFAAEGPGSWGSWGTDARGFTFEGEQYHDEAGWSRVDNTYLEGAGWQVADAHMVDGRGTDMSQALPFQDADADNDFALWCGAASVEDWVHPDGYGNMWHEYVNVYLPQTYDSLRVRLAYSGDFEGGEQDYFRIRVKERYGGWQYQWHTIHLNDVPHERSFQQLDVTAMPQPGRYFTQLSCQFISDDVGSDEDGVGDFPSDIGAVWLDNFLIECNGDTLLKADFEGGALPPELSITSYHGAGIVADLYYNLYSEDRCLVDMSYAWAFFDLNTDNPEYPIPVVPYGPPYIDNSVVSPVLERAHAPGDPVGEPLTLEPTSRVHLDYWVYMDLPLNALVFATWHAAAVDAEGEQGDWMSDDVFYYGRDKRWLEPSHDITGALLASANGDQIAGVVVSLDCVDMCAYWCDFYGDGTGHTPGPYFDNVRVRITEGSGVFWGLTEMNLFQDDFPASPGGAVRVDAALNVEPAESPVVVVGDSTAFGLNMDLLGGVAESWNPDAGELRPELRLWWRVTAGPHAGALEPAMADPDGSDGIWSPWTGEALLGGEAWGTMQADSATWQGQVEPHRFACDFADDYFAPGDVITYFFRTEAADGTVETMPQAAMASDPANREHYRVRCLPGAGATLLLVEDGPGALPAWEIAFRYNGYTDYDVYTVQAPDAGLQNGLAGRASAADLAQYAAIVWDSGELEDFTIGDAWPEDKVYDTLLLSDWLAGAEQDAGLWVMGDRVATDLGQGSPFLATALGAELLDESHGYWDYTGIVTPKVFAVHPALEYLGGPPSFWVYGGCPLIAQFSVVAPLGGFAETSHAWSDSMGYDWVAGICDSDPEGDGSDLNAAGYATRALFNPFTYRRVRDLGYGMPAGMDYTRLMVGHVLERLFGHEAGAPPDAAPVEPPLRTRLRGHHPNPFNPRTTIRFDLATHAHARLAIHDVSGRLVRTLVDGPLPAGEHEARWDGRDARGERVASGVYLCRLQAGGYRAAGKLILLE